MCTRMSTPGTSPRYPATHSPVPELAAITSTRVPSGTSRTHRLTEGSDVSSQIEHEPVDAPAAPAWIRADRRSRARRPAERTPPTTRPDPGRVHEEVEIELDAGIGAHEAAA